MKWYGVANKVVSCRNTRNTDPPSTWKKVHVLANTGSFLTLIVVMPSFQSMLLQSNQNDYIVDCYSIKVYTTKFMITALSEWKVNRIGQQLVNLGQNNAKEREEKRRR